MATLRASRTSARAGRALCGFAVVLAWSSEASAQTKDAEGNIEHTIIVGVGAAAELELGDGSVHPGANVMVEWDAIEDWLELEVGISVLAADRGVEVPPLGRAGVRPHRPQRDLAGGWRHGRRAGRVVDDGVRAIE